MNIYIHVFANYLKALACIHRADFESNDCTLISTSRHVNKILYRGLQYFVNGYLVIISGKGEKYPSIYSQIYLNKYSKIFLIKRLNVFVFCCDYICKTLYVINVLNLLSLKYISYFVSSDENESVLFPDELYVYNVHIWASLRLSKYLISLNTSLMYKFGYD